MSPISFQTRSSIGNGLARRSVVNPRGRFWDVDNLYAADGAAFPTSSGYNPTLTICAVALRTAHGMVGTSPAVG